MHAPGKPCDPGTRAQGNFAREKHTFLAVVAIRTFQRVRQTGGALPHDG